MIEKLVREAHEKGGFSGMLSRLAKLGMAETDKEIIRLMLEE